MDAKFVISWSATLSQFGLLLTGVQICLKIIRQGSTGEIAVFPFLSSCISAILWTKYGLLVHDFPITVVSAVQIVCQSVYLQVYYFHCRDKTQLQSKLFSSFCFICCVLIYIKYYEVDDASAIFHLGLICCVLSVAVYGSPLVSLATVVRKKSTECLTFSLCLANFLVSVQWCIYGYIVQDNVIKIPNGLGALLGSLQLSLFICYPSSPARTVTYTPGTKPRSLEI